MRHLILAFYLLALIAGTTSLSQTFMIWQRHRKPVIRRYGFFLLVESEPGRHLELHENTAKDQTAAVGRGVCALSGHAVLFLPALVTPGHHIRRGVRQYHGIRRAIPRLARAGEGVLRVGLSRGRPRRSSWAWPGDDQ